MQSSDAHHNLVQAELDAIVATNKAKAALDGLEILHKLLQNIVKNPHEDKFRQIKGTNPKIQSTLMALQGAKSLLKAMNFTEIEPDVFVFLEGDVHPIAKCCSMVDDKLMPVRMEFMTPEEKEKQIILNKRKAEMAEKQKQERAHAEQLKKLAEYDRQEKAGQKVEASHGNKLTFGANVQVFKPPVSKGG